ncbi:MAG: hypothetical protein ACM31P_06800 [Actinomycetota bacterium]
MQKTRKNPAPPAAAIPNPRPGLPRAPVGGKANPRLQADQRWQRTKRYGWDGR